jgi:hypothetical protein
VPISLDQATTNPPKKRTRGRLVVEVCVVVLIILVLVGLITCASTSDGVDIHKSFYDKIKNGDDGSGIVILDPVLIEMLASDKECIANLKKLSVFSLNLSDPRISAAAKLKNVKSIDILSCSHPDKLLQAMRGIPSVEEVYFETSYLPHIAIDILGEFPNLKRVIVGDQIVSQDLEMLLKERLPGIHLDIPDLETSPKSE